MVFLAVKLLALGPLCAGKLETNLILITGMPADPMETLDFRFQGTNFISLRGAVAG